MKKTRSIFHVILFWEIFVLMNVMMINTETLYAESYVPRLTAPASDNKYYFSNINIFHASPGYGMPNCTAYAFGRAYELLGAEPKLCHGNAGKWWTWNIQNSAYSYGDTPKLGAIAVWDKWNNDNGHVAVVEAINGDEVVLSESHYRSTFFNTKIMKADGSNYMPHMRFNGYIYIGEFDEKNFEDTSVAGTYWGHMTEETFRPVITINNPDSVREVCFKVWTTGDQSDLKSYEANYNGNGSFFKDINFNDFENNIFICHVYVTGYNNRVQSFEMVALDCNEYEKPNVMDLYWGSMTEETFRPVVTINNPDMVREVRFKVWTTGDQSDLKEYVANYNGSGSFFKDIAYTDLKNQRYLCHVYIYGKDGSEQGLVLNTFDTYNADGGFESVISDFGTVTIKGYAFDKSDLNSNIYVHCYIKNSNGDTEFLGVALADQIREDVNTKYSVGNEHGFLQTFTTSFEGDCTVEVSAINIGGGNDVTFLGAKTVNVNQPVVRFESCGGTECDSMKITELNKYGTLPTPQRMGYHFEGWYTEKIDGRKIEVEELMSATQDVLVYAHWACEHDYKATIVENVTCLSDGSEKNTCIICGDSYITVIPATGHGATEVKNKKVASCTVDGYTGDIYCTVCNQITKEGTVIKASGHVWDKGTVTKPATCTSEGEKTYTCGNCDETRTETIVSTGHGSTEVKNKKAATCTVDGYTGDIYCTVCNQITKEGTVIKASGHVWGKGTVTKPATCTSEGEKTYTCGNCGETRAETIAAAGHGETIVKFVKAVTCTEDGYTGDTYCNDCGQVTKAGTIIKASGHAWDKGTVTKPSSCTNTGEMKYTCGNCGETRVEAIIAAGHGETIVKFVKAATCAVDGYTGDVYCKNCNQIVKIGTVIEATGHAWDKGTVTKKPTCTSGGEKKHICENCGETKTESLAATGHGNTVLKFKKAATCTADGYTGDAYCGECGQMTKEGTTIPMTGHSWNKGVVTQKATATATGTKTYTCQICSKTKKETIPATGAAKGTTIKDTKSGGVYQVLVAGKTVGYQKPINAKKTSVTIPATITYKGNVYSVTNVAKNAFANNKYITSVKFGKNVTTIGANAFKNCVKLKSVTFGSGLKTISATSFYKCTALTSISIPKNVTTIGKQAFYGCKNLKTITVNSTKLTSKTVGASAFGGIYSKPTVKVPKKQATSYKKLLKSKGMSGKAVYKAF